MEEKQDLIKDLEQEIVNNKEKYKDILNMERKLIKSAIKKWDIHSKEKELEYEDFFRILHAIVLKDVLKRKEENY